MKTTILSMFLLVGVASAQQEPAAFPAFSPDVNKPVDSPTSLDGKDYKIGSQDRLKISVYGIPAMTTEARVSASGTIEYQPIGVVTAVGLSENELARALEDKLRHRFIKDPKVTVFVNEYSSQPVSIVGAVRAPGSYQIMGEKTLIDMLAKAGDRTETAGGTIQVIRGDRTIAIDSVELFQKGNSSLDIPIQAGDKINVLYAQYVTVVGEVARQGQVQLKYGRNVSVMDVWAEAGGPTPNARKKESVILREHVDGKVEEIPVDLDKLLARQIEDVAMQPGDVLYVPASAVRSGMRRVFDSLISVGVGRAIYMR